jgi:hypothetical protein
MRILFLSIAITITLLGSHSWAVGEVTCGEKCNCLNNDCSGFFQNSNVFCVCKIQQIHVLPITSPPTRTRLNFDRLPSDKQNISRHYEIEWDPHASGTLSRFVVLQKGEWRVSLSSDRLVHSTEVGLDFAWQTKTIDDPSKKNLDSSCSSDEKTRKCNKQVRI